MSPNGPLKSVVSLDGLSSTIEEHSAKSLINYFTLSPSIVYIVQLACVEEHQDTSRQKKTFFELFVAYIEGHRDTSSHTY
jgi:hypothetical protein